MLVIVGALGVAAVFLVRFAVLAKWATKSCSGMGLARDWLNQWKTI